MIVGGFLIRKDELPNLDKSVIQVKESLGLKETDPVKWDMGRCHKTLEKLGESKIPDLRKRMISLADELTIQIIMSHVWMGDPRNKLSAWRWSFENILQRICIILDRKREELENLKNYPFMDIVFDWLPARGPLRHYFDAYRDAYISGFKFQKNVLPPLREFKVCPCLLATSSFHSLALQLTDFFIGATGDFFIWSYKGKKKQSVRDYFCKFFHKFRRDENGNVVGSGLIVKSQSKKKVISKLQELELI